MVSRLGGRTLTASSIRFGNTVMGKAIFSIRAAKPFRAPQRGTQPIVGKNFEDSLPLPVSDKCGDQHGQK
jgi:hypothetical protein